MIRVILGLTLLMLLNEARSAVQVIYVNGGSAPDDRIEPQAVALVNSLTRNGVPSEYIFRYFPIAQTRLESANAILCQREFSRESFPTDGVRPSSNEYREYALNLGERYQDFTSNVLLNPISCRLSGGVGKVGNVTAALASAIAHAATGEDTIVLVGYSQGNNYIEGAVALALAQGEIESLDRIRIVGIGSTAFTSIGDRYINGSLDEVVYETLGSDVSLPATYTYCIDECLRPATEEELIAVGASANIHFLVPSYLNENINSGERLESIPRSIAREVAAAATSYGSDTDGDGIPDNADSCPEVPANRPNGCPLPTLPETDLITYEFTGEITWANQGYALGTNGINVAVGMQVSGRFTYDASASRTDYGVVNFDGHDIEYALYGDALKSFEFFVTGTNLNFVPQFDATGVVAYIMPEFAGAPPTIHALHFGANGTGGYSGSLPLRAGITFHSTTPFTPISSPLPETLPSFVSANFLVSAGSFAGGFSGHLTSFTRVE